MYGLTATDAFFRIIWRLNGIALKPVMHSPHHSLSLQEFWGKRWNRMVGDMLADLVYLPLRRTGWSRMAAGGGTFVCSGALHIYPLLILAPPTILSDSLMLLAYFVVQISLIGAEKKLRSVGWWAAETDGYGLRRLWVWMGLVLPSPLVIAPYMRVGEGLNGPATAAPIAVAAALAVAVLAVWRSTGHQETDTTIATSAQSKDSTEEAGTTHTSASAAAPNRRERRGNSRTDRATGRKAHGAIPASSTAAAAAIRQKYKES
jgi:hypothetical protein